MRLITTNLFWSKGEKDTCFGSISQSTLFKHSQHFFFCFSQQNCPIYEFHRSCCFTPKYPNFQQWMRNAPYFLLLLSWLTSPSFFIHRHKLHSIPCAADPLSCKTENQVVLKLPGHCSIPLTSLCCWIVLFQTPCFDIASCLFSRLFLDPMPNKAILAPLPSKCFSTFFLTATPMWMIL